MQIFNHGINRIRLLFVLNIDFVNKLCVSSGLADEDYRLLRAYPDTQDLGYFLSKQRFYVDV